jgi:hypothetical protein
MVVKPDREILFKESNIGLYYHNTANRDIITVSITKENIEGITDRDCDL